MKTATPRPVQKLFFFLIALLVGAHTLPRQAVAQQQTVSQTAASNGKVSKDAITRHVTYLASDKLQGRRAGTPAADAAAKYIANEFQQVGLKPLAKTGFLQPFAFVSGVRLGKQNRFAWQTVGRPNAPPIWFYSKRGLYAACVLGFAAG